MKVILDQKQVNAALTKLADQITGDLASQSNFAVVGIRSRGETLAQRLAHILAGMLKQCVPMGTLDITLYRDDLNEPDSDAYPAVRSTEIPFDISGKVIILVDDVLYTGRSVRAAMDALIDFGRPKAIRLAVLVDRGYHELPIQADYAGMKIKIAPDQSVNVMLTETDGIDQVIVQ